MTRKAMLIVVGLTVVLASMALSAGPVDMKPGEWSITMKARMEGMPMNMPMPPITVKQCLTEKDLVPSTSSAQQKHQDCKILDQKIEGNTVTWAVSCTDKQGGTVNGKGSVTYSGTAFSGSSKMTMTTGGRTMNMGYDMTGKWLGPCKKTE